ncbi:alpha/beta hydrolase family protein [Ceratobasidium sp. AG-Ba]|nr:alpha/beta hydrolase family protein [Ceratobasidium sp. AG-Ba]
MSRRRKRYTTGPHTMLYSPESPSYFEVRPPERTANGNSQDDHKHNLSVRSLVETHCPSLVKDYKPTWWLPGGHIQTLFCVAGNFTAVDEVIYERTLLGLPDGGTLGLDFTPRKEDRVLPPETPILVVLHGLSGGSHESYVRSILSQVCAPTSTGGLGYRAVVVNFRGCAGVPLTSPQFYSAGHTDDIRTALSYIQKTYPLAKLTGLGFSLGANVLVRYLGEEGVNSRLDAGCALGCPWNLVDNSENLEGSFFYRNIYSRAMGGNLLKLLSRHLKTLAKLPPSKLTPHIPRVLALRSPTLREVDAHLTIIAGGTSPPFPFPTPDHYYEWARSDTHVDQIKVPFLALNAADDPIVRTLPVEAVVASKTVVLGVTPKGGHLGWFEGGSPWNRKQPPPRWVKKPVVEWVGATNEVLVEQRREVRDEWALDEESGFILEKDRRHIGFKVLDLDGIVVGTAGEAEGVLQGL